MQYLPPAPASFPPKREDFTSRYVRRYKVNTFRCTSSTSSLGCCIWHFAAVLIKMEGGNGEKKCEKTALPGGHLINSLVFLTTNTFSFRELVKNSLFGRRKSTSFFLSFFFLDLVCGVHGISIKSLALSCNQPSEFLSSKCVCNVFSVSAFELPTFGRAPVILLMSRSRQKGFPCYIVLALFSDTFDVGAIVVISQLKVWNYSVNDGTN